MVAITYPGVYCSESWEMQGIQAVLCILYNYVLSPKYETCSDSFDMFNIN